MSGAGSGGGRSMARLIGSSSSGINRDGFAETMGPSHEQPWGWIQLASAMRAVTSWSEEADTKSWYEMGNVTGSRTVMARMSESSLQALLLPRCQVQI